LADDRTVGREPSELDALRRLRCEHLHAQRRLMTAVR
jgi:hypothetical protein